MSSDALKAWWAEHAANGCRIEPLAALHFGGPTRFGAFVDFGTPQSREVSAFVTVPGRHELDREVPISRKAA